MNAPPLSAPTFRPIETICGDAFVIRTMNAQDGELYAEFLASLSPADRRFRFFFAFTVPPTPLVKTLTEIDHERHEAFAAFSSQRGLEHQICGIARFVRDPVNESAEFAVAVRSDLKGRGLGYALLQFLVAEAGRRGVRRLYGDVMKENEPMRQICVELGFRPGPSPCGPGFIQFTRE